MARLKHLHESGSVNANVASQHDSMCAPEHVVAAKRLAFDDPQWTQESLLAQIKMHREADQLVHGVYWTNGRGCAVGCMAHASYFPHLVLAERYGVDERLFQLCDVMFERLPSVDSLILPERFIAAIKKDTDTSLVWHRFAHWLLADSGLLTITDANREAISSVAELHRRAASGTPPLSREWSEAAAAAVRAMRPEAAAEAAAAEAAEASVETWWSRSAAWWSRLAAAGSAARLALSAARSALPGSLSGPSWQMMSDKLIELLGGAA